MVSGRGGGHIGRGGSSSKRGGDGRASKKSEAEKKRSDAAHLRGSYRYTRYGIAPPLAFSKRESSAYRRRFASPSAASSSSSSRLPPMVPVKMEVHGAPAFGDYVDDAELARILPKLDNEDNNLDTVVGLVSETSRRETEKAEEWRLVPKKQGKVHQGKVYRDLGSDDE